MRSPPESRSIRVRDRFRAPGVERRSRPMTLTYPLVAGLLFGLYFSLVGIGINLVFGVMRIVNLAHGDFLMLGAFVAFGVYTALSLDPLLGVPVAFVLFWIAGLLLY